MDEEKLKLLVKSEHGRKSLLEYISNLENGIINYRKEIDEKEKIIEKIMK